MFVGMVFFLKHFGFLMVFGKVVCCHLCFFLCILMSCCVGCYMGCEFAGVVCYADDLALLAPSPSALRIMLHICEDFATLHGLRFNANKTRFGKDQELKPLCFVELN